MSDVKLAGAVNTIDGLIEKIRPVITERNLLHSDPKTVRRTVWRMIEAVREDEAVVLSGATEKERARAERKRLLYGAKCDMRGMPTPEQVRMVDEAVLAICRPARKSPALNQSLSDGLPEVKVNDWLPSGEGGRQVRSEAQLYFDAPNL